MEDSKYTDGVRAGFSKGKTKYPWTISRPDNISHSCSISFKDHYMQQNGHKSNFWNDDIEKKHENFSVS